MASVDIRRLCDDPNTRQILEERALALAQLDTSTDAVEGVEVLTFRLGEGMYSLPAVWIREVQSLGRYTRLPTAPSFVLGLVNVRGRLLAALDIRPLLEMAPSPFADSALLIIIHVQGSEVALLADAVFEVQRVAHHLAPTPAALAGRSVPWIRGVDDRLHLFIDPPLLLHDPRLIVKDTVE